MKPSILSIFYEKIGVRKIKILIFLLVSTIVYLSYYKINIGENAVVYRFNKIIAIKKDGGLEFKLPFDSVVKVRPHEVRRLEIGFRSDLEKKDFSDRNASPQLWEAKHISIEKKPSESLMITSDENIVDVNCIIHYQIKNLKYYLINLADPILFIQNVSEASIRTFLGREKLKTILVENKSKLQEKLKEDIQQQLDAHSSGMKIVKVNLQDIHPPVEVVKSFRDVTSAREDKNTLIYEALEYKESEIPMARASAHKMVESSHALARKSLLTSQGDLKRNKYLEKLYVRYKQQLKLKKYFDYISETYSSSKLYIISDNLFNDFELFLNKNDEN